MTGEEVWFIFNSWVEGGKAGDFKGIGYGGSGREVKNGFFPSDNYYGNYGDVYDE